jgi:thiamine biosynthesis lipoprotein
LDVGGIAKGYAADAALAVLRQLGLPRALVAMSGDLAFGDAPPGRRGWRIGLDSPDRILELTNFAVSTSGDREQHLDSGGLRYSHILDPSTGLGLTHTIAVTVVARHGIDADALSTALSVLGVERGLAFIERRPGASALFLENNKGAVRVRESSRFPHTPRPE